MTLLPYADMGPDLVLPEQKTLGPWGRALHAAIGKGDLDGVRLALSKLADPNACAPLELETLSDGNQCVSGGYPALHAAIWAIQVNSNSPLEEHEVSLSLLSLLLEAGADPNGVTIPWPDAMGALEALILVQPRNLMEATGLLLAYGARPTVEAVDQIVVSDIPEAPSLLACFYQATAPDQHRALSDGQCLAAITRDPLSPERLACLTQLVRHGADLDRPVRSAKGGRLLTPAQAIVRHNENGKQQLARLRKLVTQSHTAA